MDGGKGWLWIGLGCGALVVVGGLACGGLALLSPTLFASPEDVDVVVDAPLRVHNGQEFEIRVTVTNGGSATQTIRSVEITDTYGDGIAITSSDPMWDTSEHDGLNHLQWYDYTIDVEGGGSEVLVFHASPLYDGDWGGDVRVCVNTKWNYTSHPIRTLVEAPGALDAPVPVEGVVGGLGISGEPAAATPAEATWE